MNVVRPPLLMILLSDPVLADLTEFRLELLGYRTRRLRTVDDATASIIDETPALLILDSKLGEVDGLAWLATLRATTPAEQMPVLVFSLDPSLDTVRRAYESGAQDYLITPFDPTVMEQKIAQGIAFRRELVSSGSGR